MLPAQWTLRRNPRRGQRLDRSRDILSASLAPDHKCAVRRRPLEHENSIGENKAKVTLEILLAGNFP